MTQVQVLYMDFIDEEGKKRSISIEDPKEDLEPDNIKTTMDLIINKDIFAKYKLIKADGARYVTRTVEEVTIE